MITSVWRKHCRLALLAALTLSASPSAPAQNRAGESLSESVVQIPLARGTEISVLLSQRIGAAPSTAILLFAGYPGILRLREEAGLPAFGMGGNFLIRARRFLNTANTFTVAVDCPQDQWNNCGDAYRSSAQHAQDIQAVIAAVKAKTQASKVYVVGTSYGTVSTAFLAAALPGHVDGAVHTATFTDPNRRSNAHGQPMATFDWSRATVAQLFVHHKDDPCGATRYDSVVARKGSLPLIAVQGSDNASGPACEARSPHGFVGREQVTMQAIHDWITDRKLPATVGEP